MKRIAVIGAGAAGCFCAIGIKRRQPEADVFVLEAGVKPLAKVAVTGGGRCNLTNSFADICDLREAYPRGAQLMKRALARFDQHDTQAWFESRGVPLVLQDDQCVFPRSQDAMDIVRALEREMRRLGVRVLCSHRVARIETSGPSFRVHWTGRDGPGGVLDADSVVLTAGGKSRDSLVSMLPADVAVTATCPSLFTFNIDDAPLKTLMGAVVEDASVSLAGTKFRASGPLLVTDWGLSGPAVLKLSSYAAVHLAERQYRAVINVAWLGDNRQEAIMPVLTAKASENARKLALSACPEQLSARVWRHVVLRSGLREDIRWAEVGSRGMVRLAATLACDSYNITGRCHFKGEFVTCGGVSLDSVNIKTLESKGHPGLYFAGEVLDVDAITGGFNLQAAWSTAWTVAESFGSEGVLPD